MITKTNGNLTALLPVEKSFYQGITTYHVNARANEMLLDSDIQDFEERRFKLVAMLANRFKQAA